MTTPVPPSHLQPSLDVVKEELFFNSLAGLRTPMGRRRARLLSVCLKQMQETSWYLSALRTKVCLPLPLVILLLPEAPSLFKEAVLPLVLELSHFPRINLLYLL